ncbi:hypothetical protein BZG36_04907 [Bifiguratus adelaidae]|uniref:Major facilitator superfamily (MFS) profile domain-containing protein n=1 Tax=Bifiguratus adelaidae TaxID=1938954 RepID=A0A261XY64_9FUNG|nr:hypothetical protein BZG36_04907 [Bifiguratus adelaidae]
MTLHENDAVQSSEPLLKQNHSSETNYGTLPSDKQNSIEVHVSAEAPQDEVALNLAKVGDTRLIFAGLFLGIFLSALDGSIVSTIYPRIGSDYNASNQVSWVILSYMLSFTALQPLYGRLSDIFGRQSTLLFATTSFFIGSAACGAAPGFWSLVAARAVAGIGGGGLTSLGSIIMSDLVSVRERGKWQGMGTLVFATASILGAPMGGFLSDYFSWRYCFYINLPVLVLTFYITITKLSNYNVRDASAHTMKDKLKKIDYLGSVSLVTSMVLILLATSWGGNLRPWSDPVVITCLAGGVVTLVGFVIIEAKVAEIPIMPWHVINSRMALSVGMANFWASMSSLGIIFLVPMWIQVVLGKSAATAGLYIIPKFVAASASSIGSGFYMSKTGKYLGLTWFAFACITVGCLGIVNWSAKQGDWMYPVTLFLDGFGMGTGTTTILIALLAGVERKDFAVATSLSYLFKATGNVLGVSLSSAIVQGLLKQRLESVITGPDAADIIDRARKSITEIPHLPLQVQPMVIAAYEYGLRWAFAATALFGLLALFSSLFMKRLPLRS